MSRKTVRIEILSPHSRLYCASAYSAQIPLHEGLIGVLPGHAPLTALLGYGLMRLNDEDGQKSFVIDGGFVEIGPDGINILANHAENLKDVDLAKAREDYSKAQELGVKGEEEIEYRLQALAAARTRLKYAVEIKT